MRLASTLLILAVFASSCFKADAPVKPYDRGDVISMSIAMGEYYGEQLFYDLNTNSVVSQNPRTAWDFAFTSEENSDYIKLNSGRFMFAAKSEKSDFSEVTDTVGLQFNWDNVRVGEDSSATKGWALDDKVYVVNMGFDLDGDEIGFRKIKFTKINDQEISFEYMKLDGTDAGSGSLKKDGEFNFVYYSMLDQKAVKIEPKKEDYDLYFGQYVFYFAKEDQAYYVNGVLLNPHKVEAGTLHGSIYEEIDQGNLSDLDFSTQADKIGYDWKYYDFEGSRYEVVGNRNYIVKDVEGFIYKLRFTGFYNNEGIKGYPQFELKKL